ncbi:MAG TPA: hypothetical protein VGP25_11595 [Gemmatimonadaceae bacterium]|jgi:hypothetical protein|nr:hypothetical protein [Gemmatimonadaceae bacterium]
MPDEGMNSAASGRDGLATQLRALEEFVARSESEGDALPPEANEMIARLREIVQALDGLTASIATEQGAPPAPDTPPDGP